MAYLPAVGHPAAPIRRSLPFLTVLCAVVLVYANHFGNGFHFDDGHAITSNPAIRSLANVPRFFTDTSTASVLPANRTYRPIVSTSLAIDYALGHGYVPFWFQFSTFVVFLAQLSAMYVLFRYVVAASERRALFDRVALVATAWYGLHPAIAETVNYIIQRADVYAACGDIVALATYVRFPRLRRYGVYLVPAALAMLSKAPAIVFPLLLGTYVFIFESDGSRRSFRVALSRALPAAALALCALLLEHAMTPPSFIPTTLSFAAYVVTQPYVLLRYALAFALPLHLNIDSDLRPIVATDPNALLGDVFVIALIGVVLRTARDPRWKPTGFGVAWFLIAALPTAVFPLSELENDHRMYFPFVGLALAATWTIATWLETFFVRRGNGRAPNWIVTATLVVLSAYAMGTVARNVVWHSDEALWYDAAQKSPQNGRALMNYGLAEMQLGKYDVAGTFFARADPLTPNYSSLAINEGVLAAATGNRVEAERHFRYAIALAPQDDRAHYFYASWLHDQGRLAESATQAAATIAIVPTALDARALLVDDLDEQGMHARAVIVARETLELVPADPQALAFLGGTGSRTVSYWIARSRDEYEGRRFTASIASAMHALAIDPNSAAAYNNIGAAEMAQHHYDRAIVAERRALTLEPTLQIARNNLAWSLAHRADHGR